MGTIYKEKIFDWLIPLFYRSSFLPTSFDLLLGSVVAVIVW